MTDQLYPKEIKEALKNVSGISPQERENVIKKLGSVAANGMTPYELTEQIKKLKYGAHPDFGKPEYLDPAELETVKKKLLDKMEGK